MVLLIIAPMLVESASSYSRPNPEALFEEARRHRRRRWSYVAVGIVIAAVATTVSLRITGGSPRSTGLAHNAVLASPHAAKFTGVTVYFEASASRAEENAVVKLLRSNSRVARVQFVSKVAAFATLKRAEPQLAKRLAYNPLPDSLRVTLTNPSYARALLASLRRLPRGVQGVTAPRKELPRGSLGPG